MKVKLRRRPISKGRQTLYLDIYPPAINPDTGKLQRLYYLEIYIYTKPKTELEKEHNRETLALAEFERAKRQLDVQNAKFGFLSDRMRKGNFIDFFQEEADKRKKVKQTKNKKRNENSNSDNWRSAIAYFKSFAGELFPFNNLNETFCEEYAEYLLSSPAIGRANRPIKTNTAVSYYAKFKTTLKVAYKKGFLTSDLGNIIESINPENTHRAFLFKDELQRMADADCPINIVKRAGLFSALTGFRFSDVEKLLWKEVHGSKGNFYILYNQEKTESAEYFPVSDQAIMLLGDRGHPDERPFDELKYEHVDKNLPLWLANAGIEKHFTFHGFRHTFATLQIESGTSLYTVSKLLGHKSIKTTEIYAQIVDSLKKEATERIKLNGIVMNEI